MRQFISAAAVIAIAFLLGFFYFHRQQPADDPALPPKPVVGVHLMDGLGTHTHPVTSAHAEVQRWFDQGLMLSYGFNHDAAERAFLKAADLDPQCAMCWWGAALVLGPHVNSGMDAAAAPKAWERLQKARSLAAQASEPERAYIEALAARYAEVPPEDRRPLDEAYAASMKQLVQRYPDDLDAATLYAEALMDLQPWDYWDAQGQPKGGTAEAVSVLESVIARNPDHPGTLHLYIHAVEASPLVDRGVAAADRLRELVPASGHLVHMPAHIYVRVGRYQDAMTANRKAIESDDAYLALCQPQPGLYLLGYVPHNHHFLWYAASFAGSSVDAVAAAEQTAQRADIPDLIKAPGYSALQSYWMTPLLTDVRFGRWDTLAARAQPARELSYAHALWLYGQGLAAVRQNRLDAAQQHADALVAALADPAMAQHSAWGRYSLLDVLRVAERTLAGELAAARKDYGAAIAALEQAVALEDQLPYDEPSAWHLPSRQVLGAVLVDAGRGPEAEAAFRKDLERYRDNGWSLFGLAQALELQQRGDEARAVRERFAAAWAHADVQLKAARF